MDWNDESDNGYDHMAHDSQSTGSMPDEGSERGLDPLDIDDPTSAYLFLSDDAQDEITGTGKKKMKCLSCGYRFMGEIYDRCPKCESLDNEEVLSLNEGGECPNMRCLDCGHTFVGEIYDRYPECFSSDTSEVVFDDKV